MNELMNALWFVVALAFGAAFIFCMLTPAPSDPGCNGVSLDALSEAAVDGLLDAGWRGDPTDGRDALYAPSCIPPGDRQDERQDERRPNQYDGQLTPGSGA